MMGFWDTSKSHTGYMRSMPAAYSLKSQVLKKYKIFTIDYEGNTKGLRKPFAKSSQKVGPISVRKKSETFATLTNFANRYDRIAKPLRHLPSSQCKVLLFSSNK
eukprot:jgi/Botrbrau1/19081/Bobra.0686s0003.1